MKTNLPSELQGKEQMNIKFNEAVFEANFIQKKGTILSALESKGLIYSHLYDTDVSLIVAAEWLWLVLIWEQILSTLLH